MKRYLPGLLSVIALFIAALSAAGQAGAGALRQVSVQEGAPTIVSYQGKVDVNGQAYSGTGYFKFAVIANGDTTTWSNDGTLTGNPPQASVALTVTNGLFTVLLGDTSRGMSPLTSAAFTFPETKLQVWFATDNFNFQHLAPDQRIAAVPYAMQAEIAKEADRIGGYLGSDFAMLGHKHSGNDIYTGTVGAAYIDDGPGSTLNADLLDDLHADAFQARITETCAVGSTIRAIYADGSVDCEVQASRAVTVSTALIDAVEGTGQYSSLTIGADGLGLISYYDNATLDLKVAHCSDALCSTADIATLDNVSDVGKYTSLAIGADGLGLISYYDTTYTALKVAHCQNVTCTAANTYTLDNTGAVGQYTSLAIGADGYGLISYYDSTNGDLKVAHCGDADCSEANVTLSTLDSLGAVGQYTSLALGVDGFGLISYYDSTHGDLKVAHCGDAGCSDTNVTLSTLDGNLADDVGLFTSIAIGADGLGLISHYNNSSNTLRITHCGDVGCADTNATSRTLDAAGANVGLYTALTIGADGLGLVSYYDRIGTLKVAQCINVACNNTYANIIPLGIAIEDIEGSVALTLGADGLPLMSYFSSATLRVAHCNNALCSPYLWRR